MAEHSSSTFKSLKNETVQKLNPPPTTNNNKSQSSNIGCIMPGLFCGSNLMEIVTECSASNRSPPQVLRKKQYNQALQEMEQNNDSNKNNLHNFFSTKSIRVQSFASNTTNDISILRVDTSMSTTSFSHKEDDEEDTSTQRQQILQKHFCHPSLATFKWETSSPSHNNFSKELENTYSGFRSQVEFADLVLRRLSQGTTVPAHFLRGENSKNFQNGTSSKKYPINCYSEPLGKMTRVRGKSYKTDGIKVPSSESMFAIIGVDSVRKNQGEPTNNTHHMCSRTDSFYNRLYAACEEQNIACPFLLVVNFVVPWGNLLTYMYRPDGVDSGAFNHLAKNQNVESAWSKFLNGTDEYRNSRLKFIPHVQTSPWVVKKLVGSQPCLIGQKLPTTYHGSIQDNYLEICLDVTKGSKVANKICNSVAGHSSQVTIDLAFLIEGVEEDETLPEQLLACWRLHHINLKRSMTTDELSDSIQKL